jgi:hypothetical protein
VPSGLRMRHAPGPAEPLLWLPDVVAGAAGATLDLPLTWVEA